MIRVDSMESYNELRESGYNGDILVLMKGGEDNVRKETDNTDGKDDGKNTDKTNNGAEADGKETDKTDGLQLNYEKIIDGVTEKIKPLIQKQNRDAGTGAVKDDTLDDIMAKFAEM